MFSRRLFMAASGAALWAPAAARAQSNGYHFTLGVASGSPRDTSVVLWTRLAPNPLRGGGMPAGRTSVRYRVCVDETMRTPVRDGVVATSHEDAHAVHVTLKGLEPGREYWYQFHYGEDDSPIGRTRTTSAKDATARVALASCQSWEAGYWAAYRDMAEWAPDCVIHVGDYIYEGGIGALGAQMRDVGGGQRQAFETVRQHNSAEITSLWDYRNRYALYKSDPMLQAAHAASPWIMAMDDHEVDNNWAGETPQDPEQQTATEFAVRKIAALKAYYEHMPIEQPPSVKALKAHLQMYGLYRFGPAQVFLLDTRQYRSDQPCGDNRKQPCATLDDPALTMTGEAQEKWFLDALKRSGARYNVMAQQTWFSPFRYNKLPEAPEQNRDQWDGYPVQRQRMTQALARAANPIVLSGDWHCAGAMTLHKTPGDKTSDRIGHEFAGASIASGCPWARDMRAARDANPHVAHLNGDQRGYLRCAADGSTWTSTYRVVADAGFASSPVSTDVEIRTSDL